MVQHVFIKTPGVLHSELRLLINHTHSVTITMQHCSCAMGAMIYGGYEALERRAKQMKYRGEKKEYSSVPADVARLCASGPSCVRTAHMHAVCVTEQ